MLDLVSLLRQSREDDIWHRCCGFVDLSLDQFMAIQRRLLMEQLTLLSCSQIGHRLLKGQIPSSVEEFQQHVPMTTYNDYCPELPARLESVLPVKPFLWQHTSGRTGEYGSKWVPLTARFCERLGEVLLGLAILSACSNRNQITRLKERPKMVYAVAPPPYTSGTLVNILDSRFPLFSMPELSLAETMSFEQRIRDGLKLALRHGLDGFGGLSLALVTIGERFSTGASSVRIRELFGSPASFLRLTNGFLKSRISGRPLLPRYFWNVMGITSGGTDSIVMRDRILEYWGRYPLDTYTCTEGAVIATQTWNYRDLTFIPYLNFLEFIPERDATSACSNTNRFPRTLLLDEVEPGQVYELVITNFHGGPMTRYRIGDMVRITSMKDEQTGIPTPQMAFERRADDLIDLGGFIRLTEKTIWKAIENSGIPYVDWVARKRTGERPVLELYIEPSSGLTISESIAAARIFTEIRRLDERVNSSSIYDSYCSMVGNTPVVVQLLPNGAFERYTETQRRRGSDLAHLKPPHISPDNKIMNMLLGET